jgi:hypothetical protein
VSLPDTQTDLQPLLAATHPIAYQQPYWLGDEGLLRDEGVLFGLSDAQPDEKVAEIKAYFTKQTAPNELVRDQYSEKISELNLLIEQRETKRTEILQRLNALYAQQPAPDNLIRTVVSLCVSIVMSIGTFFLVDETLQASFPNRWVAIGVFLAGMFNLFGRQSFFYEENTKLSGRRLLEEAGLPLAASVFVLAQALHTQAVWQAVALFIFIFFLFLLAGKLLLSTLTTLRQDITITQANRQLGVDKHQQIPLWEAQAEQLTREVDTIRAQKWPVVSALNRVEADIAQLNAQRDRLVNLFLSEFELARSLRSRLSESQRQELFN